MAIENTNLTITQGDTLNLRIYAKDSDGNYLDLTSHTVNGQVRYRYSSTGVMLQLYPVIHDSYVSGIVDVTFSGSQTSLLPVCQYVYDIEVCSGNNISKVANGYIDLTPEVTRG